MPRPYVSHHACGKLGLQAALTCVSHQISGKDSAKAKCVSQRRVRLYLRAPGITRSTGRPSRSSSSSFRPKYASTGLGKLSANSTRKSTSLRASSNRSVTAEPNTSSLRTPYLRHRRLIASRSRTSGFGEVTIRRRCAGVCTGTAVLRHRGRRSLFRRTRSWPSRRRRLGPPTQQGPNRSLIRCRRACIGRRGESNSAGLP